MGLGLYDIGGRKADILLACSDCLILFVSAQRYLFNIRGGDVHRTPAPWLLKKKETERTVQAIILSDTVTAAPEVVLAYGMVELHGATVFLDQGKLAPEAGVSQLVGRCYKQEDCQMFPVSS